MLYICRYIFEKNPINQFTLVKSALIYLNFMSFSIKTKHSTDSDFFNNIIGDYF